MTLDINKPVMTRDGKPARIICTDRKGSSHILVALVEEDGRESFWSYRADGQKFEDRQGPLDLVNVPTAHTGWIHIYKMPSGIYLATGEIFESHAKALAFLEKAGGPICCVDTIKISWKDK